jgi:type III restriction enzyme
VEGYTLHFAAPQAVCDFEQIETLVIDISRNPTETFVMPQVGIREGDLASIPFQLHLQGKAEFYDRWHLQTIQFQIAQHICNVLAETRSEFKAYSRAVLFPQVVRMVELFCEHKVDYQGQDPRELAIERYFRLAVEKLLNAIRPVTTEGEPEILPLINRFTPRGSSGNVNFITSRPCHPTLKSHVDQVVLDTETWERSTAYQLEASAKVNFYLRTDKSGFRIPYEFLGVSHSFHPDFIVKMKDGEHVILEVKGMETDQDKAKYEAAKRWCTAVTNWKKMGTWRFLVCRSPGELPEIL